MIKQDIKPLDDVTPYIIHRVARLLRYHLSAFLEPYNLSPEQWFLVYRVYTNPDQVQSSLADKVLGDNPNITRLLDGLVKRGMVARSADVNDRRVSRVSLTDQGRQFFEDIYPQIENERATLAAGITLEEVGAMQAVLQKYEVNIIANLES